MTALATRTKYKLSRLQMAAEASLAIEKEEGNRRSSQFAASEAASFDKYWKVVDHKADTDT